MKECYGQKGDGDARGLGNTINVRYSKSECN